ncbi:MAG: DUF6470 family protein [Selenomonadaceae bacterium]|nr:DUF6470 family protein [Selenomonadaceae bacterium]
MNTSVAGGGQKFPMISIRQTLGRIDRAAVIPAQIHTNPQMARSNKTVTQPSLTIDSYPSRKAYGHRTMSDLTAENGAKGISDVQAATRRHSRDAWQKATTAARRGDDIAQAARAEIFADCMPRTIVQFSGIPNPTVYAQPCEVVGEPQQADFHINIQTESTADIHYTPGSIDISV